MAMTPRRRRSCSPTPGRATCTSSISTAPSRAKASTARRSKASSPAFPGKVQVGGGIRDRAGVDRWLALGVERVIIGTAALKDPEFVKSAARDLPGRIIVGVDARDGMVATEGWADVSDVRVEDLARRFEDAGVAALLFTDVGRDGLLKGCNVEATVALARAVAIPVIACGGVADISDIHALRPHVADGIEGVITGRALYDGRLDLAEAIAAGQG